ncbi:hypothetical protein PAE4_20147 [Bacillus altitudinis]|uniref:Uncharacterized protein n=1 Tax=Bacillus altitudinis TaxID=293387 RepID=A0A653UIV4_BACAB|nr:hypothetical protein PAE4_20147 [Bacillus altitudinis]VXB77785.1 hypothetical protein BACI9J_20181 [Bacillus altitudinis]VXB93841.1 hypothetical protein BACI348_41925 [Bacillus altitudinis]
MMGATMSMTPFLLYFEVERNGKDLNVHDDFNKHTAASHFKKTSWPILWC